MYVILTRKQHAMKNKSKIPLSGALIDLKKINEEHIGWNVFDTSDGPQGNTRHPIIYTRDAFWKKRVSLNTIKSILDIINTEPSSFSISHNEYDKDQNKFVIHQLSDPLVLERVVVLKIHRLQLDPESIELLEKIRDDYDNNLRVEFYRMSEESYAEWVWGQKHRYEKKKSGTITLGGRIHGTNTIIKKHPFYQ